MNDLPCKTHNLKTDPDVFQLSWDGKKPFEIRYDDRGFLVGDEIVLKETKYTGKEMKRGAPLHYTKRRIRVKILSYVMSYGLQNVWCAMGVEEMHRIKAK